MYLPIIGAAIFFVLTLYTIIKSYSQAIKRAQSTILQSIHDPTLIIASNNTISFGNNAFSDLTGIANKDLIGKDIDTTLPLYNDQLITPFTTYNGKTTTDELILHYKKPPSNEVLPLSITLTVISYNGDKKSTLMTLRNLSQEKQLEEMKVDFVSMAAHELRTPLTAIRGYTSLLQIHYATNLNEQAKELLTRLLISTTTLANLIDNLLVVSRIERNNIQIDTRPLDIMPILQDIFESFKQQTITKKQQYTLSLPPKLPLVMVDPFRIGQVFINLIQNAISYTPEGGTIAVTVTPKETMIEFCIQDTGEGIPTKALPHIFKKFFRVSGSLEQGSKGTGLGLYITKSILEMHHGTISAESTEGKGSKFTFTLPIATNQIITEFQKSTNAFLTAKNGQAIIKKGASTNAVQNKEKTENSNES